MNKWPNYLWVKLSYMPYGLILGGLLVALAALWIVGTWRVGYFLNKRSEWCCTWVLGIGGWLVLTAGIYFLFIIIDGAFPYPPSPKRPAFTCDNLVLSQEEIQRFLPNWDIVFGFTSTEHNRDYYGTIWQCSRFFAKDQDKVDSLEQIEALRRVKPVIVVTIYRFSDIFGPRVPWLALKSPADEAPELERSFHSTYARVWRLRKIESDYVFEAVYDEFYLFIDFETPLHSSPSSQPFTLKDILDFAQREDRKIGEFVELDF
ncbi:MAG TPA: hypothetical protein ENJ54_11740 [Chloroflexi bacterium]|nr:hypothetical protein [Chloroflexota bacterium]